MEQIKNVNLPICGRIQHGEQQILNGKTRVVELGYFIAKIKNDAMNFLLNRFNEKYNKMNTITIRFFDENPLSIKRVRYNQSGTVCYCMSNETQAKQKVSNSWKTIDCTEDCQYRISAKENVKPMCNFEGTLKFLLPEISTDRIWIMKITGQTSIKRLKEYIDFQKHLGNSLIGDYTLFLKREEQINKNGKTFNNCILDIIKKDDFNSQKILPTNTNIQNELSTKDSLIVDNSSNTKQNNTIKNESKNNTKKVKTTKTTNKSIDSAENTDTILQEEKSNEFDNYYILVETFNKTIAKDGKPTEYLVGSFCDMKDNIINVIIPPELKADLLKCDIGTTVILDLAQAGSNIFTKNITYVQKCLKNIAA